MTGRQSSAPAQEQWPPSWFTPWSSPISLSQEATANHDKSIAARLQYDGYTDQEVAIRARLKFTNNAKEIRHLLREVSFDQVHTSRFFELAYDHIFDAKWHPELLAEYFLDPILNPPGSKNYHNLSTTLRDAPLWVARRVLRAVCDAAHLGLVPYDAMRQTIQILPATFLNRDTMQLERNGSAFVNKFYRELVHAISTSNVVSLEILGQESLQTVLQHFRSTTPTDENIETWWSIRQLLGKSEPQVASDICLYLLDTCRDLSLDPKRTTRFLQRLPANIAAMCLSDTTTNLVAAANTDKVNVKKLRVWKNIIRHISPQSSTKILLQLKQIYVETTAKLSDRASLSAFAWIVCTLCTKRPSTRQTSTAVRLQESLEAPSSILSYQKISGKYLSTILNLESQFVRVFRPGNSDAHTSVLEQVVNTLKQLHLPLSTPNLSFMGFLGGKNLRIRSNDSDVLKELHQVQGQNFQKLLLDDDLYHFARSHRVDRLQQLSSEINKDLRSFFNQAEELIKTDPMSTKLISRVLRHNLPLQRALARRDNKRSRVPPSIVPLHLGDFSISPEQASNAISRLTCLLAVKLDSSPRTAFKKVFWFYQFLSRLRVEIDPMISRALWHAGVTRWEELGLTKTRFHFVLNKVREIEGDEVADLLLTSPAFRDERKRELLEMTEKPPAWLEVESG